MTDLMSRTDAILFGLDLYFTGVPCGRGHVCERHVRGHGCVACRRMNSINESAQQCAARLSQERAYRRANKEDQLRNIWEDKFITRDEALAAGLDRYFVGPCRNGHTDGRYTVNGMCAGCKRAHDWRARGRPGGGAISRDRVNKFNRGGITKSDIPLPLMAGHCDKCRKPFDRLCWDHDHVLQDLGFTALETHRGWLCVPCNTGLGKLGDNERGLLDGIEYLRTAAAAASKRILGR